MFLSTQKAQGRVVGILFIFIFMILFFVNLIIRKILDNEKASQTTAPVLSTVQDYKTNIDNQNNPTPMSSQISVSVPQKSGPKNGINLNKEIIHEPSIKGELLVQ